MALTLHDIAIGHTYRLTDRRVGCPLIIVERVTAFTRQGRLDAILWVYEPARHERYPTSLRWLTRADRGPGD
jgi:hypothetical protein